MGDRQSMVRGDGDGQTPTSTTAIAADHAGSKGRAGPLRSRRSTVAGASVRKRFGGATAALPFAAAEPRRRGDTFATDSVAHDASRATPRHVISRRPASHRGRPYIDRFFYPIRFFNGFRSSPPPTTTLLAPAGRRPATAAAIRSSESVKSAVQSSETDQVSASGRVPSPHSYAIFRKF